MHSYLTADEIKAEELAMLIEFDNLCKREGLRYSLAGGTLLGAVRHKGFIPWDDDIDVSMPRPDFDRLVEIARSGPLLEGRAFEPYSNSWEYPVFLKYINQGIAVDAHYENGEGRLWMDITPVEGLSEDAHEVEQLYARSSRLQRILMFCKSDPNEGRTIIKRLFKRFLVPVANSIGVFRRSIAILDGLGRDCAFGSTSWVGCTVWGLYGVGERYPYSGWKHLDRLEFEGRRFNAISCWDIYLSGLYGDYMQLPPVNKRTTHEVLAWKVDDAQRQ